MVIGKKSSQPGPDPVSSQRAHKKGDVSRKPKSKNDSGNHSEFAAAGMRAGENPMRRVGWQLQRLRRWSLALADATAICLGIAAASRWDQFSQADVIWVFMAIPIWIFVGKVNNLYDRDNRRIRHSTTEELPSLLATSVITIALVRGLTEIVNSGLASATMIILGTVAFVFSALLRSFVRWSFRQITLPERTLVIGSGRKAELVSRRLANQAGKYLELVGYVADTPGNLESGPALMGARYAGDIESLTSVAREQGVSRLVIADDDLDSKAISRVLAISRGAKLGVTMVPANQNVLGPQTELNRIADVPMLDFHFSIPPRSTMAIKRSMDLIVSVTALTISFPFLLAAAVLIKIDSKGPVFFRQVRIGKDGGKFTMYKLRTMVRDAEEQLDDLIDLDALDEPAFKIPNDPRITRVGRFLRRSSLDEVPQFINVLSGKMSLVGPRPEEEAVVALYDERQRQRLSVKPGLTGPMQVAGRGSLNFEERLALERDYLDNITISGDIGILMRTPRAVIMGDGAF